VKEIAPKKIPRLIKNTDVVVVQWGSERCLPCRKQEKVLDAACGKFGSKNVTCVKVDVDAFPKAAGAFHIQPIYPAVSIFKNGNAQPFIDTVLEGKRTETIYMPRPNIELFLRSTVAQFSHR
jgi:hypothetical protein